MKVLKLISIVAIVAIFFSSCAIAKAPLTGLIYTGTTAPVAVTSNEGASKVGTAKAISVLGLVATGQAGVQNACKNAGITKIHHVDEKAVSVLGIFASYEVIVYGE